MPDLDALATECGLAPWAEGEKPPLLYDLGVPDNLCWKVRVDEGRAGYLRLFGALRELTDGQPRLEVGYGWGGRELPGSKVLDLYDTRPDVDYRLDACRMEGLADASFTVVTCNSVLEHIPRFWEAGAEIQRVLRPGGYVWASVPYVWSFHPETMDEQQSFGGDYWRMTHQGISSLFDQCRRVACFYIGPGPSDYPGGGYGVVYLGQKHG